MKHLITTITGYHPLAITDLGFIQEAFTEAFKGVLSTYGVANNEAVILSGCEKTVGATDITFSEGWVSIGGEVCFFPAQVIPLVPGEVQWFVKNQAFDPEGTVNYQTSGPQQTYEVITAQISSGVSIPNGFFDFLDAKNVYQLIREGVNYLDWVTFPDGDDDDFYGTGNTPLPAFRRYYKDIDGFVHLKGEKIVDDVTVPTDIPFGQLDPGFRPPDTLEFVYTHYVSNVSANFFRVRVESNGIITALQVTGNFAFKLHDLPSFRAQ